MFSATRDILQTFENLIIGSHELSGNLTTTIFNNQNRMRFLNENKHKLSLQLELELSL